MPHWSIREPYTLYLAFLARTTWPLIDFLKVLCFSFPVGSWPQREGLSSSAACQIYWRNFPPVGFIQSQRVYLIHCQSNPITPHETWLELFWSKFNWTLYFLRAVFQFYFSAYNQIQSFSGHFIFLHLSKVRFSWQPRSKKTLPTCFVLSACKFLFFYVFFHGICKPEMSAETELTNITRRHFCSLLVFVLNILLFILFTFCYQNFFLVICLFWHTLTARDDTGTQQHKRQGCKMQIVCAKMTSLDVIFWRGNKSSSRSLARICQRKHKKSTAQSLLSWTIWAWLVGKSKPLTVQGQLQRQSSFANANITGYVYRQSQFFFSFLILSFKMASACPMLEWWEDFHVKLLVFCWLKH